MSDLTERLRNAVSPLGLRDANEDLIDEAAAEIARLTAALAEREAEVAAHDAHTAERGAAYDTVKMALYRAEERSRVAEAKLAERDAVLAEALAWYAEQARLCRLIHSGGDAGRNALAADGGQRARAALARIKEKTDG